MADLQPSPLLRRTPLVVAHRGASEEVAEHTLRAYTRALTAGADGLECDVRLTADGHLVCLHDRRTDRTGGVRGVVSTLELAQLGRHDFAAWRPGPADVTEQSDLDDLPPGHVLTLERLCRLVADHERPVQLSIETKHPTRYAGLVERTLVEVLRRFGWDRTPRGERARARVMSFSWTSLRRVREAAPGVPLVLLMDRVPLRHRDGSLPLGCTIAGPGMDLVRARPAYVDALHAHGHDVHVWTVNDEADLRLCVDLGVEAVITDRPADTVALLREWR